MTETIKQFPHCDARVLHAKGECEYCDRHPDWQELREVWKINFTGQKDPSKALCPAEKARGLDSINKWGGNRPSLAGTKAALHIDVGDLSPEEASKFIAELKARIIQIKEAAAAETERECDAVMKKLEALPKLNIGEIPAKGERISLSEPITTSKLGRFLAETVEERLPSLVPDPPEKPEDRWPEKPKATLSGRPAELPTDAPAPAPIDPSTGMHKDYWVLPEAERKKGFVRPYRDSYRHVGLRPKYPVRDLTPDELEQYSKYGYYKYEEYPKPNPDGSSVTGRFWTKADLERRGCGTVTTMGRALSETYARDPKYYGSTFCCGCRTHYPVAEFVWTDGSVLGS
jgi:hypothetical protein